MGETSVSNSDITSLRDILDLARPGTALRLGTTSTDVTFELLDLLERLLGTDWTSFGDMQITSGRDFSRSHLQCRSDEGDRLLLLTPQLAELDALGGSDLTVEHWWQLGCSQVDRTGVACVTSTRTHFTASEWANHPLAAEDPCVDEMLLAYPLPGGRSLRVRAGRDTGQLFGLRELTLMELLLPHLRPLLQATLDEHSLATAACSHHAELTGRQREILHLVALGMPNRQVGRQLGISEGTVRKHLENVYERLGVQNRTEAIFWLHGEEAPAS